MSRLLGEIEGDSKKIGIWGMKLWYRIVSRHKPVIWALSHSSQGIRTAITMITYGSCKSSTIGQLRLLSRMHVRPTVGTYQPQPISLFLELQKLVHKSAFNMASPGMVTQSIILQVKDGVNLVGSNSSPELEAFTVITNIIKQQDGILGQYWILAILIRLSYWTSLM